MTKFLLFVAVLFAEGSPLWINNSDCPIEIKESESRSFLEFMNKDAKPVIEMNVGCLEFDNHDKMTIGDIVYQKKGIITASGGFHAIGIEILDELKAKCKNTNSRIGIIRIKFADGSFWELGSVNK
jgi:hypothetical protein